MAKPTIKLRPKTQRVQREETVSEISVDLKNNLQNISAQPESVASQPDLAYFRPKKKQISIRLDADVLAWFQAQPGKYQQLVNKACRQFMENHKDVQ